MKQNIVIGFLLGVIGSLMVYLVSNEKKKTTRSSRTLKQMSPTYNRLDDEILDIEKVGVCDIAGHVSRVSSELIQPDMTELEAKQVSDFISRFARQMISYNDDRKEFLESRTRLLSEHEIEELKMLRL